MANKKKSHPKKAVNPVNEKKGKSVYLKYLGYAFGAILIIIGIIALVSNRPDRISGFLGNLVVGLIIILLIFFKNRNR